MSETCRVLYKKNLRNSASCWLLLQEYIMMHGPLNVKSVSVFLTDVCVRMVSLIHDTKSPQT